MNKQITITILLLIIATSLSAASYEFSFAGFSQKKIRVKYEIFKLSPIGFDDQNEFTYDLDKPEPLKVDLKKSESIRFEAFAIENPRVRTLIESRTKEQLLRRGVNRISFSLYEDKDPNTLLTLPQLFLKVAQDKFASGLLKDKSEMIVDTDLPIGTLIFYNGQESFFKPSIGIIDREVPDLILNQYNHKIEDLVRIEQGYALNASSQPSFINQISAGIDINKTRFFQYSIQINNLSKRQANSFIKDPFDIFKQQDDAWLEAIYNLINRRNDKTNYKLYFVFSKTMADNVYINRKTFREFTGDITMLVDGGSIIEVSGSGKYYSLAQFEKLDSLSQYYVAYEALDMTPVLLNEANKRLNQARENAALSEKAIIDQDINSIKERLMDNYQLLKQYAVSLPQEVSSVNQIVAITSDRRLLERIEYETDSLGNILNRDEIDKENTRIEEVNKYLQLVQQDLILLKDKTKSLEVVVARLWRIENNIEIDNSSFASEPIILEKKFVKTLNSGQPREIE